MSSKNPVKFSASTAQPKPPSGRTSGPVVDHIKQQKFGANLMVKGNGATWGRVFGLVFGVIVFVALVAGAISYSVESLPR